jgi:hypothetical protein
MCLRSFRVKVMIFRAVSEVPFDKWQLGGDYFPVFALCAVSKETTADEVTARCEKGSGWLQKKVSPLWMTAFESVIIDMPLSLILLTHCSMWLRVLVTKWLSFWLSSLSVDSAGVRSSLQRCYNQQSALPFIHISRHVIEPKVVSNFDFITVSPKILIGFS